VGHPIDAKRRSTRVDVGHELGRQRQVVAHEAVEPRPGSSTRCCGASTPYAKGVELAGVRQPLLFDVRDLRPERAGMTPRHQLLEAVA
jgi:hypothetical protein